MTHRPSGSSSQRCERYIEFDITGRRSTGHFDRDFRGIELIQGKCRAEACHFVSKDQ